MTNVSVGITPEVAEWFEEERGIALATLESFGVHVRPDGAVIFPYDGGEKIRKGIPTGERKFVSTGGGSLGLFNRGDLWQAKEAFIVEGETDTMRLWQEVQGSGVGVVGIPGLSNWKDEYALMFENVDRVYVILDNDQDYNVQGTVETTRKKIRAALGRKAKQVRLPGDVKDICEFFDTYDLDTLRLLCTHKTQAESRFKTLDLTTDPPPVKWLVDGLLCSGDIHLLLGEPGIGKSWLTMSLALAIAAGHTEWCKRKVHTSGRVLYIDEENPEDLIFDRLRKLGMSSDDARNIRYLNNLGIRLDRGGDDLIEEALDYEPTLIVLDSLTRMHTGDEDKASAMSALYNDGIKPLARETGAAVLLIHHANKSDSSSSYRRSRGSGEIVAQTDAGFDIRATGINTLAISNFKSRRKQMGEMMNIAIEDTPEGGVRVVGAVQATPVF